MPTVSRTLRHFRPKVWCAGRTPLLAEEEQTIRARLDVALQMPAEFPAEERGKDHSPGAFLGLGPTLDPLPVHPLRLGMTGTDTQFVEAARSARDARVAAALGDQAADEGLPVGSCSAASATVRRWPAIRGRARLSATFTMTRHSSVLPRNRLT